MNVTELIKELQEIQKIDPNTEVVFDRSEIEGLSVSGAMINIDMKAMTRKVVLY